MTSWLWCRSCIGAPVNVPITFCVGRFVLLLSPSTSPVVSNLLPKIAQPILSQSELGFLYKNLEKLLDP